MTTYSIDGPDGKTYSIDGPPGAKQEDVIAQIQKAQQSQPSAGGLRDRALNSLPPELREYAQKALSQLGGQQNAPGYSPYKPAQPGSMPNDAINPVGTDAQMTAGLGAAGAVMKGLSGIPRVAAPSPQAPQQPPAQPPLPFKPPTLGPTSPMPGTTPPPLPGALPAGPTLQNTLLKQAIHGAGHFLGGPLGGAGASGITKALGL